MFKLEWAQLLILKEGDNWLKSLNAPVLESQHVNRIQCQNYAEWTHWKKQLIAYMIRH